MLQDALAEDAIQLEYTIVWSKQATRTVLCVLIIPSDFTNVMFLLSCPGIKGVCFSELFTFQFIRCVNSKQLYFGNLISPLCKKRSVRSCFHTENSYL